MKIRPILPQDDAVIAKIIRSTLEEFRLAMPGTAYCDSELDHLSEYYAHEGRQYFICEAEDGTVIGGCGYAEFNGRETAEMQKLYLIPAHRGKGISSTLIERVERSAAAEGYHTLYLETHHNLISAIHIYEKKGYKLLQKALGESIHTTMDYFFIKNLKKFL